VCFTEQSVVQGATFGQGEDHMVTKRRLTLFALQFPMTLLVGALLYFAYSLRVHDNPTVDWVVAIVLALVLDVVITWLNGRDERRRQKTA
jgi:hypothetical protein